MKRSPVEEKEQDGKHMKKLPIIQRKNTEINKEITDDSMGKHKDKE